MFIKYPRTLELDVGDRTSWVHVSHVPQRGLSSLSVGFLSTPPPPQMSTEISLRPGRWSMPVGAAPYLSHPFALKPSLSLSSLGIAPASKVRSSTDV
ncbi:hypothetical protein PVAP13_3KG560501 [Panicum virgatum]|uniref:Uncharacterized protein n=1 Tax=Panicum virgatum TaxID=38727 RepID=A0A8T0VCA2_PANVG|nr:hypothetical protein PVAP13_3KG560501 [Panicum virgatum]